MRAQQNIYYAELSALEDESFFEEKLKEVSKERRDKVLRCKHREDQIRSLGAGLLVKKGCERMGIVEDAIAFLPEALNCDMTEKHYCNISHAGNMAVVVISSIPTGIDVESLSRFSGERGMQRMESILRKIGTETEKARITAAYEGDGGPLAAAILWTRKEARAKTCGLGLGMDFATIDTYGEGYITIRPSENDEYVISSYPDENLVAYKIEIK